MTWDKQTKILAEVIQERVRQETLRIEGVFAHTLNEPDYTMSQKLATLTEELGEISRVIQNIECMRLKQEGQQLYLPSLRNELLQLAALSVAWLEGL